MHCMMRGIRDVVMDDTISSASVGRISDGGTDVRAALIVVRV